METEPFSSIQTINVEFKLITIVLEAVGNNINTTLWFRIFCSLQQWNEWKIKCNLLIEIVHLMNQSQISLWILIHLCMYVSRIFSNILTNLLGFSGVILSENVEKMKSKWEWLILKAENCWNKQFNSIILEIF